MEFRQQFCRGWPDSAEGNFCSLRLYIRRAQVKRFRRHGGCRNAGRKLHKICGNRQIAGITAHMLLAICPATGPPQFPKILTG